MSTQQLNEIFRVKYKVKNFLPRLYHFHILHSHKNIWIIYACPARRKVLELCLPPTNPARESIQREVLTPSYILSLAILGLCFRTRCNQRNRQAGSDVILPCTFPPREVSAPVETEYVIDLPAEVWEDVSF